MKHDIGKLPKWAQDHIGSLEHERNCFRQALRHMVDGAHSRVKLHGLTTPGSVHYLPDDIAVEFKILGAPTFNTVLVRQDDAELVINGHRSVAIYPEAGNALRIRLNQT